MTPTELNQRFGIKDALTFETAPGGLTRALISTPLATAEIYLQGAHIAHWTPSGRKPVLFMSSKSFFAPGKAIRGGIPIIFPWFGGRSDGKPGPAHGFARSVEWAVDKTALLPDGTLEITFTLSADEASRALGFDAFHVRFTVALGAELDMSFEVTNNGSDPLRYEEALHTYFAISDIDKVAVNGLEGTTYIDKTDGFKHKTQPAEAIHIAKETDQVHLNSEATCTVSDPVWNRSIVIAKTGSSSTVVWNPWVAKTAGMADMAPDEWRGMVCVETANAADNTVVLAPGHSHRLTANISVA
jgi:glucose-6-phosphate 1-epimerase